MAIILNGGRGLPLCDSELRPETVDHAICRCARWEKAKVLSIPIDEKDETGMVNREVGFLPLFIARVINFVCAGNRFDVPCAAGEADEAWVKKRYVELDRLGRVVFRIDSDEQWLHGLARRAKFVDGGRNGLQIDRADIGAISVAEINQQQLATKTGPHTVK